MKNIYKRILKIAIPVAFENLVFSLINFVDIFMIGKIGASAIRALGIIIGNIGFGIGLWHQFGKNLDKENTNKIKDLEEKVEYLTKIIEELTKN